MRVAIYARVSTDKQETDNQALQLGTFATSQGWDIVVEFRDEAISGAKGEKDRPAFRKMFEAASKRQFDILLFWSLDRLIREGVLPTLTYLERLTGYGIKWRSFTEQYIDSCGIFADAVISIMAVIAKQENVRRSERTRAGLERVKRAGKALGRPRRLNGEHTAQIAGLRKQGLSGREIARRLGISEGSVRRLSCVKNVTTSGPLSPLDLAAFLFGWCASQTTTFPTHFWPEGLRFVGKMAKVR